MVCAVLAVLLLVACTSAPATAGTYEINVLVDALLEAVDEFVIASSLTSFSVPDYETDFKEGFLKGGFKMTRGSLSNFSTVGRTADATLDLEDKSATVNISMGLSEMMLYFEHCRAWVGALSTSEKLSISVGTNSIEAVLSLIVQDDDTCQVSVQDVSVTEFSDLEFDLKSLSFIKPVANDFADWIISYFQDSIKSSLESGLKEILDYELENFNWCSYLGL